MKLTQATDVLNCVQTGAAEATDLQMEPRHMDMEYSTIRWSDKPYTTYGTSGPRARDGIRMARDRARQPRGHRGRAGVDRHREPELAVDLGLPHDRRADGVGRGRTSPSSSRRSCWRAPPSAVSVAGGLRSRWPRPSRAWPSRRRSAAGVPCLYGSFFTVTDMRTGSPAFGTPESVFGVLAGGAARAAVRPAVPRRRRSRVLARGGRPGGGRDHDDAVGHDARRHRCRAARGGLAGGRPHRLLREVRARRRVAAPVQAADGGDRVHARRRSRSTR